MTDHSHSPWLKNVFLPFFFSSDHMHVLFQIILFPSWKMIVYFLSHCVCPTIDWKQSMYAGLFKVSLFISLSLLSVLRIVHVNRKSIRRPHPHPPFLLSLCFLKLVQEKNFLCFSLMSRNSRLIANDWMNFYSTTKSLIIDAKMI